MRACSLHDLRFAIEIQFNTGIMGNRIIGGPVEPFGLLDVDSLSASYT